MDTNKVIGKNGDRLKSDVLLHPGYILEMELEARKIKKGEFSKKLNIKAGHLSELLHEKRNVSVNLAIKLEELLSIEAEFWLKVQLAYDLAKARKKHSEAA